MRRIALFFIPLALFAQAKKVTPQIGNPIPLGESIYRSNCAFCHGLTGKGGRGPDLTGRRNHGATRADVSRIVKQGIPGTSMPAYGNFETDEVAAVVGHVQKYLDGGGKANARKLAGNAGLGKKVYAANGCAGCHKIEGQGSVFGPDLSRIGAARSAEYLRDSIVKPSADIPPEWEGVTAVIADGRKVQGLKVNEDSFTVQLRDASGKFRSFDKSDLKSVVFDTKSLMPAYDKLAKADLDDLLAYLDSLRATVSASGPATKAKGIQ